MNLLRFIITKIIKHSMKNHSLKIRAAGLWTTVCWILVLLATVMPSQMEAKSVKPPDVDYYTCTMHPSVRSQDPDGKCPICGMDLVPVKKRGKEAEAAQSTNSENAETPGEFTVPVERRQLIGVTYATIEKQPFLSTLRTVGMVAYDKGRHWDYVARVEGYVSKLSVFSRGELVDKNSPLLSIYSPDLLATENEFVNLLKTRDDARARDQKVLLESSEQLVGAARQRLRLWNITDEQITNLENTRQPEEALTLYSPFKGVVQDLDVDQGRHVSVGDHLVDVADLSDVWVWVQFYQDDLSLLKSGLPVTITTSSYPGETFDGKISVVDPFLNNDLRTARVRIDVENADFKLRPDMYVDVELDTDNGEGLAVPADAVLPTGTHNIVFVDKGGGRLQPRFIELGRKYGDFYEVKSGLNETERVVTSANFLIDAEAKVQGALKSW
jgi:membrane fusion protein, copper/silver efflux system